MESMRKNGVIIVPFMTGMGGTEKVIQNLFKALNSRPNLPFSLTVFSIGGSDNYDWSVNIPIKVIKVGKKRWLRTLAYAVVLPFIVYNYLRKNNPDFVISTNPMIWFLAKLSLRILRKKAKVIAWYHYSLKQKPIKNIFLMSADHYLAISSGIVDQLVKLGVSENQISLIYNPIPTSTYVVDRPQKKIKFIYIGRIMLDGQKNIKELLYGLKNVKGSWQLDLYGDSTQSLPVKQLADKLDLSSKLIWHEFVEDPWSHMENATALVLTSKYEGLPMVLCEAISHGVFIVSSDVETGPSDIVDVTNGLLFNSGDVDQLSNILQEIVDGRVLPSQQSIKNSAKKFEIETYTTNFCEAVNKVLKSEE